MTTIMKGFGIAMVAAAAIATPARADVATSMTATLSGSDITFLLSAEQAGTFTLADLSIELTGGWKFDGNASTVQIREGGPSGTNRTSNYTPMFVDGSLTLLSNTAINTANAALAPIWIRAGLSSVGTSFTQMTYQGDFYTRQTGTPQQIRASADSFGGTVTPEPVTMLLLGSGLAGVAGMRRRRKPSQDLPVA